MVARVEECSCACLPGLRGFHVYKDKGSQLLLNFGTHNDF